MLHCLRRSILFVPLLVLGIGCTKRIDPVQSVDIRDANLREAGEKPAIICQ